MPQDRMDRPVGQRPLTALSRLAAWGLCLALVALALPARPGCGQPEGSPFVLGPDEDSRQYGLTISGAVGNEAFQGAQGILTVSTPPEGSLNPYQIVVVGFPTVMSRNTFYWNSDKGLMEEASGVLRCRVKGRGQMRSDNHFFYLSPALFALKGALTQHEGERQKHVAQTALPTKIFALDGELTLTLSGNKLTGRVVMTGLDPVGNDYVRYVGAFVGQHNQGMTTKR